MLQKLCPNHTCPGRCCERQRLAASIVAAWRPPAHDRVKGVLWCCRNYAPTIQIQDFAVREKGCQQVLWLYGEDHLMTEVGTMNLFVYMINKHGGLVFLLFFVCLFSILSSVCLGFFLFVHSVFVFAKILFESLLCG